LRELMTKPRILHRVRLEAHHKPTGKTRHFCGNVELPTPKELRIAKYDDDPGFYLFYCADSGGEFTDTYHDSLEAAFAQAEHEFGVRPQEWQGV